MGRWTCCPRSLAGKDQPFNHHHTQACDCLQCLRHMRAAIWAARSAGERSSHLAAPAGMRAAFHTAYSAWGAFHHWETGCDSIAPGTWLACNFPSFVAGCLGLEGRVLTVDAMLTALGRRARHGRSE